jgi:hypothetical protein
LRTKDYQPTGKDKNKINIGATVDKQLWLRLRAIALRQGKLSGDLLDECIKAWLDKHEKL